MFVWRISMAVRVGINGFGRIGRNIMRAALGDRNIDFVAVNDLTSAKTLAHLLKYDSVLGNLHAKVDATQDAISVDGDEFKVLSVRDPAQLPWKDLGVEVVFESTGLFTNRDAAAKHLAAGAKKVVITAPAKAPDVTLVLGVNDEMYDPAKHQIISNASCTTAADGPLKGLLACSNEELVSIDFKGNPHSSIVDMPYTKVMDGDFVKILSWYDNEWGYSNRCVDLLRKLVQSGLS